jgi:hypothetical protein
MTAVSSDRQVTKRDAVPATVLYMSMSLDGFIARPNESPDNSLGDDGSEARSQTTYGRRNRWERS